MSKLILALTILTTFAAVPTKADQIGNAFQLINPNTLKSPRITDPFHGELIELRGLINEYGNGVRDLRVREGVPVNYATVLQTEGGRLLKADATPLTIMMESAQSRKSVLTAFKHNVFAEVTPIEGKYISQLRHADILVFQINPRARRNRLQGMFANSNTGAVLGVMNTNKLPTDIESYKAIVKTTFKNPKRLMARFLKNSITTFTKLAIQ